MYEESELHEIYGKRLQCINDQSDCIRRLGYYFRINRPNNKIIIEEIEKAFVSANGVREKQLGIVYLINELIQNQGIEAAEMFKPLFERVAVKSAETRDEELITRVKRTLGVLVDRRYFDQIFACSVLNLIETRVLTSSDAETEAYEQLLTLTKKLNDILQTEKQSENTASKEEKAAMLEEEQKTRQNILEFFNGQINRQYGRINQIKKIIKQTKDDLNTKDLMNQFSDDSNDEYSDSDIL